MVFIFIENVRFFLNLGQSLFVCENVHARFVKQLDYLLLFKKVPTFCEPNEDYSFVLQWFFLIIKKPFYDYYVNWPLKLPQTPQSSQLLLFIRCFCCMRIMNLKLRLNCLSSLHRRVFLLDL